MTHRSFSGDDAVEEGLSGVTVRALMVFALLRAPVSAAVVAELCAVSGCAFACYLVTVGCIHDEWNELLMDAVVV